MCYQIGFTQKKRHSGGGLSHAWCPSRRYGQTNELRLAFYHDELEVANGLAHAGEIGNYDYNVINTFSAVFYWTLLNVHPAPIDEVHSAFSSD